MSITGSNNPFSCSPVVFSAGNSIISQGTITRAGNVFTFSVGFVWKINGTTYQNTIPFDLTINEASAGFFRIDNALLTTSNTIELQQGLPSNSIAIRPTYPETNLLLTSWNISGTTVGDEEAPILGSEFIKKQYDKFHVYTGTGTNVVIPLNASGISNIYLEGAMTSVAGLDFTELLANPTTAEYPHEGKGFMLFNRSGHNITLKHSDTLQDVWFVLSKGVDLVIPNNEKVFFVCSSNVFLEVHKSWMDTSEVLTNTNFGDFSNSLTTEDTIPDDGVFSYTNILGLQVKTTWSNIKAIFNALFVPKSRTITIGAETFDLSADRTFAGGGGGGGASKRIFIADWKLGGAMSANTNWFSLGAFNTLYEAFSPIPTVNPTNNFSDCSMLAPCYILPFDAKIKSYNARGFTNGTTSATLRSAVSTAFTNSNVGTTIQNALIVADVSFPLNSPSPNGFRYQTSSTGLTTTTLVKGTEIRLFNFNNNVNTPLQSTIISIEFEEVI